MKEISIIINDMTRSAGTERAVANLANNLSGNGGYKVEILSLYSAEGNSFYELNPTIEVVHFNHKVSGSLFLRFFDTFSAFFKLKKYIKKRNQIVIGTIHSINIQLAVLKLLQKENIFIGCEHIGYDAAKSLTKIARNLLYRFLDAVVVLTEADYNKYKQRTKCFVIPNQISFLPETPSSCENKSMLAIGRLTEQKGFDLLLNIIDPVLKKHKDWKLIIIGEGEMYDQLQSFIQEKELGNQVSIERFTKNVQDKFLTSSIYLMTSRFEGLPMVLLEAKACGLPVISYDCPTGPREIVKEDDGFLIPMNESSEFQLNLLKLIENESLRMNMGVNARKNIDEFKAGPIFLKWESLFNKL